MMVTHEMDKIGAKRETWEESNRKTSFITDKHEKVMRNLIKILNLDRVGRTNSQMISNMVLLFKKTYKPNDTIYFSVSLLSCIK